MAEKLERKVMEIYGENAATRDIIAYGSDIAGNIVETKDPDVIQTEAYKTGVRSAVVGNNSTTLQNRQALDFLFSRQLKYLYQHGIAEWGADETYFVNSLAVGSNGNLYVSLTDNNKGNDPVTDTTNWQAFPTPAQLAQKVAKAGDTMTGELKMSGTNKIRFGTNDDFYYVQAAGNGQLSIFNKNNKGLFLQKEEAHAPFYWNGTNAYRLLTTADMVLGKAMGEAYYSQSKLAADNPGALPLFTGETIASANTIYPDFYNWVLAHTELQCTSAEYESALSTYGECPKYVIGGGSLRLPKLSNYIKAANTADGIKNIEAGLPDHKHLLTNTTSDFYTHYGTTNIYSVKDNGLYTNQAREKIGYASESNPIYGKSDTVTPASTTLYPWVVAYAAAVPASTAQAAEFQQALSGKADTNLGNVASNLDYVVESYNDGTNWYRKYKSGWLEQGGYVANTSNNHYLVNFLKPFNNNKYSIVKNNNFYSDATSTSRVYNFYSRTTTSADTWASDISNAGFGFTWYACGQAAS